MLNPVFPLKHQYNVTYWQWHHCIAIIIGCIELNDQFILMGPWMFIHRVMLLTWLKRHIHLYLLYSEWLQLFQCFTAPGKFAQICNLIVKLHPRLEAACLLTCIIVPSLSNISLVIHSSLRISPEKDIALPCLWHQQIPELPVVWCFGGVLQLYFSLRNVIIYRRKKQTVVIRHLYVKCHQSVCLYKLFFIKIAEVKICHWLYSTHLFTLGDRLLIWLWFWSFILWNIEKVPTQIYHHTSIWSSLEK